ncbi:MAG: hypothetical protein QOH60_1893 [Mycobacterium sp.]|nr:hypothetical protein [Mycobacterium sp.]
MTFAIPAWVQMRARTTCATIEGRINALGGRPVSISAWEIISGRAALLGLAPPSRVSSGGATRLLAAADGWCALTLSRKVDVEAIPALLEHDVPDDPWAAVADAARIRTAAEFVARARLLDMPAAVLGEMGVREPVIAYQGTPARRLIPDLLVVDLSSMWAGPLCARLLAAAGATVVKVETPARPDGTRAGNRDFFDWLNGEKLCYSIDFDSQDLTGLLRAADVVIEGSRPAALARRGLAAEQAPGRPGRVWVRVSGYGPEHPDRVAFGDDAAVAGGLVMPGPEFCGDAVADPLTGLAAADAVLDALTSGGGAVIDVAMAGIAAGYARLPTGEVQREAPRAPRVREPAHEVGADNTRVSELVEARLASC